MNDSVQVTVVLVCPSASVYPSVQLTVAAYEEDDLLNGSTSMVRPCLSLTRSLSPSLYNVTRSPNANKFAYAHPKAEIKKDSVYLLLTQHNVLTHEQTGDISSRTSL